MRIASAPGERIPGEAREQGTGVEEVGATLAIGSARAEAVTRFVADLVPDAHRLAPRQLAGVTRAVAAERSLWQDVVVHDVSARWYTLLHRSTSLDLWLLAWSPEQDTDWHDHGGSSGSFTVADGVLEERYRRGANGRTARRLLGAGRAVAFGPAHVHNVSHEGTLPATSVHAYSPPLVAMTYYDLTTRGLFARATVPVDGPEGSRGKGTGAELSSTAQLTDALPAGRGIDELLAEARSGLTRLRPEATLAALTDGAVLVDIRTLEERIAEGEVPGARIIGRNVLEWRLDPRSEARIAELARFDARIVVMCQEGYVSSLAAANLRRIGLVQAADLEGGFRAWKAAGLLTVPLRLGS
ncbi:MAG TPA: rhodanese-like domain-containing protein [Acidimicrobiales bacterium]|nr:rhodanese-like domain-containing protein [Acidimicrobiales bacterium]